MQNGKQPSAIQTLEKGDIYFFYRPKVEEEDPQGRDDIQRLYMVLSPEKKDRYRMAVIGRKRLPDPARSGSTRNWGFIDLVRKRPDTIRKELAEDTYETRTRGKRHVPAARPAGEGVYRIIRHRDHTHLLYSLELPSKIGDVQEALHIAPEASYIISIKNPQAGSPRAAGLSPKRQAEFPKHLSQRFENRRFADADPPEFLEHEGAEFILVSASEDIKAELGIELDAREESAASADLFQEMKLDRSKRPTAPLFKGEWE